MTLLKYNAAGEMLQDEARFAPQGVVCSVYQANQQANIGSSGTNVNVKLVFDTKEFDPFGYFDLVNSRFQPKVPGYYDVSWLSSQGSWLTHWNNWISFLYKNGVPYRGGATALDTDPGSANNQWQRVASGGSTVVYLNGTTDYVEVLVGFQGPYADTGRTTRPGPLYTWFTASLVAASVGVAPEPWHYVGAAGEPAFVNGWSNHGLPLRFMKDPHGFVKINGRVQGTGAGTTAFTFPAGYRPQTNQQPIFPIAYWTGSARAIGLVIIGFDGTVQISGNADNLIAMTYTSLDVVHFRAEQ